MIKILHTIPGLSISSGGPSTCTYNLLKGLRAINVDVDILTLKSRNPDDRLVADDNFIKGVPNDAKTGLVYSTNFRRYLKEYQDYDLYHANALWTFPSHDTLRMAHQIGKPCVIAPHGMLYPQALAISKWKKKICMNLFQRADLEMADCLQATCEAEMRYIRNLGIKTPVAIVPNCLDIDFSAPMKNKVNAMRRVGFVGRLHRIKNVDVLLEAWLSLGDLNDHAELVIIGSGDEVYEQELKKYVSTNGMNHIRFTGFLNGEELAQAVRSLDCLILPSKSENFGMVVPEALVNGIPVIASKGTPWEELDTYKCGWWVDNTAETLAKAIQTMLRLTDIELICMGQRGRKLIEENYASEQVALRMKKVYEWILNKKEKPDFVYL